MTRPKTVHLYQKLQEEIRKILPEQGENLLPSERDLAAKFSVNRLTIRRALEELEREGEIVRYPGRGYAVALAGHKRGNIDRPKIVGYPLWINRYEDLDFVHSHARLMSMRRIRAELREFGYDLDVQFVGTRANPNMELILRLLRTWDGYITDPVLHPEMDPFYPLHKFRVLIGYEEGVQHNCVRVDFQQISRLSLRHLVERGARQILYLGDDEKAFAQGLLRTIGVESESLQYEGVEVIRCISEEGIHQGYGMIRKLISDRVEFDAVLCASGYTAVGVTRALIDSGKVIPNEVQVIGSGNLSLYHYLYPRLTVVSTVEEGVSRAVGRMMRRLIRQNGTPQESVMVATEVIQGETTRQNGDFDVQSEDYVSKVSGRSSGVQV